MNRPIAQAAEFEGVDDFNRVLGWHLQHGYVWSGSDCFIMGRPVPHDCLAQADQFLAWDRRDCDVWFVWLGAGQRSRALQRFLDVAPFKLPYVAWHRNKESMEKLKVWTWDQYDRVTKRFRR